MKILNAYEKPKEIKIGVYKCEVCGEIGDLFLRQGKQFKVWEVKCPNGHRPCIKKDIEDIFQIGDRIRLYETSFCKGNVIDETRYKEGIIVNKERGIVNYHLDMKVDKVISRNNPIIETSWLYGHIIKGIDSDGYYVELLPIFYIDKNENEIEYKDIVCSNCGRKAEKMDKEDDALWCDCGERYYKNTWSTYETLKAKYPSKFKPIYYQEPEPYEITG